MGFEDKLKKESMFETQACVICGKSTPWPYTECMDCEEFDQWVQENAADALNHQMENTCKDNSINKDIR